MPPAVYIGNAGDAWTSSVDGGIWSASFPVPAATKPGDLLIAVLAMAPEALAVDDAAWTEDLSVQLFNARVIAASRVAQEDDPAELELELDGAPSSWVLGTLLVYRGLDTVVGLVEASAVNVAAAAAYPCPSRALTRYSDLYLGIAATSNAAVEITPPAGAIERYTDSTAGQAIEIFDLLAEAVGATGAQIATTAVAHNGIAASLAYQGRPAATGRSFALAPVGAPGLPIKGV